MAKLVILDLFKTKTENYTEKQYKNNKMDQNQLGNTLKLSEELLHENRKTYEI